MFSTSQTAATIQSIAHTSLDTLALVVLIGALFVFGIMRGRQVLVRFLIALYPAILITTHFPYEYVPVNDGMVYLKLIVCVATCVAVFYILGNEQYRYFTGGMRHWISTTVLALVAGGFSCLVLYRVVGLSAVYSFSPLFHALFASSWAMIVWLVVPLAVIPLVHRT